MSRNSPRTFQLFNFHPYNGPNPYLNRAAIVFDFALYPDGEPLAISDYLKEIMPEFPNFKPKNVDSYPELFAQTISYLSQLEMDLHSRGFKVHYPDKSARIAVQSLHHSTSFGVIDLVWDWLESLTRHDAFNVSQEIRRLQEMFRCSEVGGPTSYALLRAADGKGIPTFWLKDEKLLQYGYGKYHCRGISTTFARDSHLDSDFTTLKDDCKQFLHNLGFPVPLGDIAYSWEDAREIANQIGYPVAVKPVAGHKGHGVTASIENETELRHGFEHALEATSAYRSPIIVEKSLTGSDFRLICVGGKFVAALERRPPYVIGDGKSTISELIERENSTPERQDTPTSPLAQIPVDEIMDEYLEQQGLSRRSVLDDQKTVYLRSSANISGGGVSINVTDNIHPDNLNLAEDIAQYFKLVCLGVDVMTKDLSRSWKEGNFGILEINAAPGVFMHLKPAIGGSIDVPSAVLEHLFPPSQPCRIPIITFNTLSQNLLWEMMEQIRLYHPDWMIGGVCREGVWLNKEDKKRHRDYNGDVQALLRHSNLDCLIVEYPEEIFEDEGLFYQGSDLIILDNPTPTERILEREQLKPGIVVIKDDNDILVKKAASQDHYDLVGGQSFSQFCLHKLSEWMRELSLI